jgi:hypothetical protein
MQSTLKYFETSDGKVTASYSTRRNRLPLSSSLRHVFEINIKLGAVSDYTLRSVRLGLHVHFLKFSDDLINNYFLFNGVFIIT